MSNTILKLGLCAVLTGIWVSGCKENNTPIDFKTKSVSDTTYVLAAGMFPSTPNPHNVLVEEFTGQSCPNCPAAHELLRAKAEENPNRINILALYIYGPPQANPPHGSIHDFRDSIASAINSTVYNGINILPSGGVDRVAVSGQISLGKSLWLTAIDNQLTSVDSINMDIETHNNPAADLDTIIVKVTYIYPVASRYNLSVAIIEDSMYDYQERGLSIDSGYLFTNVFRGMVTPAPAGDEIGSDRPLKEAGRVYQKVYTYKPKSLKPPNPAIKPKHCRVIAFVHNWGGKYRVIQSIKCPLRS